MCKQEEEAGSTTSSMNHWVERSRKLLADARERAWPDAPLFVCAPMVRQSELAFRMLVRGHNVPLAFTPMIPASWFARATKAERANLWQTATDTPEGPLVAQICGNQVQRQTPPLICSPACTVPQALSLAPLP